MSNKRQTYLNQNSHLYSTNINNTGQKIVNHCAHRRNSTRRRGEIYRVAQKVNRKLLSISSPNIDRFSSFCWKFAIKWLLNIPTHLNCVATLPCRFSKITIITINTNAETYLIKQLFTNFLICVKLCLVLDTLPMIVSIKRRHCRTGWAKIML